MPPENVSPADTPHLVLAIANDIDGDTRVLKYAASAALSGLRVTLVGTSSAGKRTETRLGRAHVIRIPVTPLSDRPQRRWLTWLDNPARMLGYATPAKGRAAALRVRRAQLELSAELGRELWRREHGLTRRPPAPVEISAKVWRRIRMTWLRIRRRVVAARRRLGQGWLFRKPESGQVARGPLRTWLESRTSGARWRRVLPMILDLEAAFGPVFDKLQPDIIHVHDVFQLGTAAKHVWRQKAKGRDVKLVYDAREYIPGLAIYTPREVAAFTNLEREFLPYCDGVVAVSDPIADELVKAYQLEHRPDLVLNVPLGQSRESSSGPSVRHAAVLGEDVPLVVYSGGLHESRGVHTLVEAMPALPGVHVVVVARDRNMRYVGVLEDLARELGAADRFHVVGFVAPDQVVRYLSSATVAVHSLVSGPLNHEMALPNKLFEYLHAGLPVVVSDCRTMAEFVQRTGVGEVYRSENAADLAVALRKVLDNADHYVNAPRREVLLKEYSWQRQAEVLVDSWHRVLGPRWKADRVDNLEPGTLTERPLDVPSLVSSAVRASRNRVDPPGRLLLGPTNAAGQGYAWARAVERRYPVVRAEAIAIEQNRPFRFPVDRSITVSSWRSLDWELDWLEYVLGRFTHVLAEAGLGLLGNLNGGTFDRDHPTLREAGLRMGLVFHGSEVRDPRRHAELEPCSPFAGGFPELTDRLQRHVEAFMPKVRQFEGAKFVSTLDLLDFVKDATWLPISVDTGIWRPGSGEVMGRDMPVVVHIPTNPQLKGSPTVDKVASRLADAGRIEYLRFEGVASAKMPEIVRDADILVDQLGIAGYGVQACQAMAAGRVVVGHVGERTRSRLPVELPIVEATKDTLEEVLSGLVENHERAVRAARAGVEFAREFHDGRKSAEALAGFLEIEG